MPVSPQLRDRVVEAIGTALTERDIEDVFKATTGQDIYLNVGTKNDPRAQLISKSLTYLARDGAERWFLTHILIRAAAEERLRKLIVKACPETLVALPKADSQVERVLQSLQQLLSIPLPPDIRHELRPKRGTFTEIVQHTATLFAFKSLHECLHKLLLKLNVGSVLQSSAGGNAEPDLKTIHRQMQDLCLQGPSTAALLGAGSDEEKIELAWIADIQKLATQLGSAIGAGNVAGGCALLDDVQRVVRLQLSRLNGRIFEAAKHLSIEALLAEPPLDLEGQDAFIQLTHAIYDLKPTVLARALKHKMWQDAENEFSLIGALFDVPAGGADEFAEHWFTLKSRILWLATLDPGAEWAERARQYVDDIDDELADDKLSDEMKVSIDTCRNLVRFCFLAIDDTLKLDCGSLRRIDDPLRSIIEEITRD
jgi:hypothetical protein